MGGALMGVLLAGLAPGLAPTGAGAMAGPGDAAGEKAGATAKAGGAKARAAAPSSPGRAVDRLFEAYRGGSVDRMLAIYTEDVVFEDVAQRHQFQGTEQMRALLGQIMAMHHQVDLREKRRVVQGNVVVVEYEYAGQLNGAVAGQAVGKTGCPDLDYTLPVTSWYEVRGGRIAHQRDFIDLATLMALREKMLAGGADASS